MAHHVSILAHDLNRLSVLKTHPRASAPVDFLGRVSVMQDATITLDHTIDVAGKQVEFSKAVIATGASAFVPPVPGLEEAGYRTNESIFVENDVFGTFTCDSNNNTITGNDIQGTWTVTGNNNVCDANSVFTDANANQLVDDTEHGDALSCPEK